MGHIQRLKRVALEVLPAPWVPRVAARVALLVDEVELHLLQVLCRPSGTSVDVGANLGIYTEILRRSSRAVVAVEPNPALAERLRCSFSDPVQVVEAALSSAPSRANLRVPVSEGRELDTRGSLEPAASAEFQSVNREVNVLTLDLLHVQDAALIKIDVEGHELEVVTGGWSLLRANRPRLLIELEERHRPGAVEQMARLLAQLGYQGFFVSARELCTIDRFDGSRHQAPGRAKQASGGRSRDYVNNFLFLANEESGRLVPRLQQCLRRLGAWTKVRHALEL